MLFSAASHPHVLTDNQVLLNPPRWSPRRLAAPGPPVTTEPTASLHPRRLRPQDSQPQMQALIFSRSILWPHSQTLWKGFLPFLIDTVGNYHWKGLRRSHLVQ